jgi:hypothetical protein
MASLGKKQPITAIRHRCFYFRLYNPLGLAISYNGISFITLAMRKQDALSLPLFTCFPFLLLFTALPDNEIKRKNKRTKNHDDECSPFTRFIRGRYINWPLLYRVSKTDIVAYFNLIFLFQSALNFYYIIIKWIAQRSS